MKIQDLAREAVRDYDRARQIALGGSVDFTEFVRGYWHDALRTREDVQPDLRPLFLALAVQFRQAERR